jgi:ABC-type spermidine/putrescine transport system permease subunit I
MDEAIVNEKLKKQPQILKMKASKMNEMINILRHNGITNDHILNHLRIFKCKIETVHNRIIILKQVNLPLKIFVLSYSQKMFDKYLYKN